MTSRGRRSPFKHHPVVAALARWEHYHLEPWRIIRRYLSSDSLLPIVHKCFVISQCKDGLKSKLRSSRSCITLRMSPLGVAPQVSDPGFEGSTIPRPSAIAQGSKYLRQDIGWRHRSLAARNHHLKQMLSSM